MWSPGDRKRLTWGTNSVDKPLYNLQNKLACDFESKFIKKDSMYSVYLLLLSRVMSGYTSDWVQK